MTIKSQRLVSFGILMVAAVIMAFAGGRILIGESLTATVVALALPFTLIFTSLNGLYSFLDARIAEGTLEAGDILGMLTLKEWWISMIANVVGLLQIFGFKAISADEQTVLVNVGLAAVTVLLRSFTDRAPTSNTTLKENTDLPGTG